jgi:hypothetical protein
MREGGSGSFPSRLFLHFMHGFNLAVRVCISIEKGRHTNQDLAEVSRCRSENTSLILSLGESPAEIGGLCDKDSVPVARPEL